MKVWGKQSSYSRKPCALILGFQKRQARSSLPYYWLSISKELVTGLNEPLSQPYHTVGSTWPIGMLQQTLCRASTTPKLVATRAITNA